MSSSPEWFYALSIASLSLAGLCFLIITFDLLKHPRHMWVMNLVWPVTALFGSTWIVWQYFRYGRLARRRRAREAQLRGEAPPNNV